MKEKVLTNQFVTDSRVGEEYKDWDTEKVIFIQAGTGQGKSHFIKTELCEYAKETGKKILLFSNRINLLNQNKIDLEEYKDVITCINYQKLDWQESHVKIEDKPVNLNEFDYIVADECHYFSTDSRFNKYTDLSLETILDCDAVKIFMSATPEVIIKFIRDKIGEDSIKEYNLYKAYSEYISELIFYRDDELLAERVLNKIPEDEKLMYFCSSATKMLNLSNEYKNSLFNCSKSNKELSHHVDQSKIENMLKNEKFEEQFLFATTTMDNGVNIKDEAIKHIVVDVKNTDTLIQCLGRKRKVSDGDKCKVYIKIRGNQSLAGTVKDNTDALNIADILLFSDAKTLVENLPRHNYGNLIYDMPTKSNHEVTKRVNEVMYTQLEMDKDEAQAILDMSKGEKVSRTMSMYPYCYYMQNRLFRYDEEALKFSILDMEAEKEGLSEYLDNLVGKKLFKEDQKKLIDRIDYRFNGRQIRSRTELTKELLKRNYNYAITDNCGKRVQIDGKKHTVWIVEKM